MTAAAVAASDAPPSEALRVPFRDLSETTLSQVGRGGIAYVLALLGTGLLTLIGAAAWFYQLRAGMGVTGLNHPMMWATYVADFVWWAGIAVSGTTTSAVLYLFRARFRAPFARTSEFMTLIALAIAGFYPILHLGRAWRFYYLLPYPNQRHLWPTFRSPLTFDAFGVGVYLTFTVVFLWLGLLPDLAPLRDRSLGWKRTIYGLLSLGWEGTARQWKHHLIAYSILAGVATPLVISIHSVVAWDFSLGLVPGWHSSIFPPFFVIGAVFSGLGMALTLVIPTRALLGLEAYITREHLEKLARLLLFVSLLLTFCYACEYSLTFWNGEESERINLLYRMTGPPAPLFWTMTFCSSVAPLILFVGRVRRSPVALFLLSILINVGMWLERFILVADCLGRDYLPYGWATGNYRISLTEIAVFVGSLSGFVFVYLLLCRLLPALPMAEIKRDWLKEKREEAAIKAHRRAAQSAEAAPAAHSRPAPIIPEPPGPPSEMAGVLGVFPSLEALPGAARQAREAGFADVEAYFPLGDKAAVEALHPGGSFVRYICAAGGWRESARDC